MSAYANALLKHAGLAARDERSRRRPCAKAAEASTRVFKQASIKAPYKRRNEAPHDAVSELRAEGLLSASELESRRWELAQKSWDHALSPSETLALRFIEARLDAEESAQNASLVAERAKLRERQEELLFSLENVISMLRK